jgi:NTP pyrophosphatase (non-canonical NTP hydrolase)
MTSWPSGASGTRRNCSRVRGFCYHRPVPEGPDDLSFDDFISWTHRQTRLIADRSNTDLHSELFVYMQAAKLVEEVGELHAQLLGQSKLQRRGKGQEFSRTALEGEVADVMICMAILAQAAGVDFRAALRAKMHTVDGRDAAEDARG